MPANVATPKLGELAQTLADPAFLAALCHDLRGPLGAIGTWVHVLASGRADLPTQQQALIAMQRDVAAQSRLVEQLSDLSSILGGTLALCIEEVELGPVLGQLGAELQTKASPLPKVLADPTRLRQLLAILFVRPGGAGTGERPVLVAEQATGALSLRGLFRSGTPELVGLALARALAEIQGGLLTLTPSGEGTAFAIQLPAAREST